MVEDATASRSALRDRVPGAVAHLKQPLPRRAPAAGETVAAVLARELDAELLEPVDGVGRLAGQNLDEPAIGAFVRALPDILGMLLRRIVLAEGSLDATLRLRGIARLNRILRDERHACSRALRRDGRSQTGGSAPDHEHVEHLGSGHPTDYTSVF